MPDPLNGRRSTPRNGLVHGDQHPEVIGIHDDFSANQIDTLIRHTSDPGSSETSSPYPPQFYTKLLLGP
jgi:hypothetical protein